MTIEQPPTTPPPAAEPEPKLSHGGARKGSGPKKLAKKYRKDAPVYVSLTAAEKAAIEREASGQGISISMLIRKKLKLSRY